MNGPVMIRRGRKGPQVRRNALRVARCFVKLRLRKSKKRKKTEERIPRTAPGPYGRAA